MPSKKNNKKNKKQAQQNQKTSGTTNQSPSSSSPSPPAGLDYYEFGRVPGEAENQCDQEDWSTITAEDIITQFSMSGYHRSRVMRLSNYDKITGGICWAMSLFEPLIRGQYWLFKEDEPNKFKKTMAQKRMEIEQILYVKNKMKCPHPATANDFINVNAPVIAKIVSWLLPKITRAGSDKEKYACFMGCFLTVYEDEEAAAMDFMRSLRRPNELQISDCPRMEKFDKAILRDDVATGKMILTEYIYYSRNGCKKYPPFSPGPEEGEFLHSQTNIPLEVYEKERLQLDEMGEKLFSPMKESSKTVVSRLFEIIDELELATATLEMEERFVAEHALYYEMFLEFTKLNDIYKVAGPHVVNLKKVNVDKMKDVVEKTIERAEAVHEAMSDDLIVARELEREIRSNRDANGKIQKYCPFQRQKADDQTEVRKLVEKEVQKCDKLMVDLRTSFNAYSTICKKRDECEPQFGEEEENPCSLRRFSDIDYGLGDLTTIMMAKINTAIGVVDALPPPEEKMDLEFRRAFTAYTTDAMQAMSDWYWKARFLREERREMCDNMRLLKMDAKKSLHRVHFARKEAEKLPLVNTALREANEKIPVWEKKSAAFQAKLRAEEAEDIIAAMEIAAIDGNSPKMNGSSGSSPTTNSVKKDTKGITKTVVTKK